MFSGMSLDDRGEGPEPGSFAITLREARESKNLRRADMARLLDVAPTVVTKIESGRHPILETTVRRYAEVLGMRVRLELVPE
jgi:transcriptional regulator with XRE-family HTH domain